MQEDTLEYIYCSGLFNKMKFRFLSFEKDYINSEGKIPVALVKSVAFIESATNYQGFKYKIKYIVLVLQTILYSMKNNIKYPKDSLNTLNLSLKKLNYLV